MYISVKHHSDQNDPTGWHPFVQVLESRQRFVYRVRFLQDPIVLHTFTSFLPIPPPSHMSSACSDWMEVFDNAKWNSRTEKSLA
jgi:hypothetical protein